MIISESGVVMNRDLRFGVAQNYWSNAGFSLYLLGKSHDPEKIYAPKPIVMEEQDARLEASPLLTVPKEMMQELMNELWRNGFRPDKYEADTGALEQARLHIKDLRAIAFKQLDITGEER